MALPIENESVWEQLTGLEQTLQVHISQDAIREAERRDRLDLLVFACQTARDDLMRMMDPDLRAKWERLRELESKRQRAVTAMTAAKQAGRLAEAKSLSSWLSATATENFALKADVNHQVEEFGEAIAQLWPQVTADHVIRAAKHDEIMVSVQL